MCEPMLRIVVLSILATMTCKIGDEGGRNPSRQIDVYGIGIGRKLSYFDPVKTTGDCFSRFNHIDITELDR
jgi:hypothetical protein